MLRLHYGDAIDGLSHFDGTIDCVITSPPYKEIDGYSEKLIRDVFSLLFMRQVDESLCFMNFGALVEDKMRPFRAALVIEACGYKLQETFVWWKNHYKPIQGERRVNNLSEFIFMFSKGKMPQLDRLSIGIPYADKSNVGRFADKDLKCAGNVWPIDYETIQDSDQKLHNDRFPLELPLRCLKLADYSTDWVVCDPFSGSGTTAMAAHQLGTRFIGWEKDRSHYDTAMARLQSVSAAEHA